MGDSRGGEGSGRSKLPLPLPNLRVTLGKYCCRLFQAVQRRVVGVVFAGLDGEATNFQYCPNQPSPPSTIFFRLKRQKYQLCRLLDQFMELGDRKSSPGVLESSKACTLCWVVSSCQSTIVEL